MEQGVAVLEHREYQRERREAGNRYAGYAQINGPEIRLPTFGAARTDVRFLIGVVIAFFGFGASILGVLAKALHWI